MGERELPFTDASNCVPENPIAQQLIGEVFGDNALRINNLFTCMEIAEEVIADTQEKYPEKAEEIFNSFRFLKPRPLLQLSKHHNLQLYRHHAQELVKRVVHGDDIKPATSAELACVFCEISLEHPLTHDYIAAYAKLFTAVFPTKAQEIWPYPISESYPGRTDEIIGRLREKFSQER
jgi:hypothetical protein